MLTVLGLLQGFLEVGANTLSAFILWISFMTYRLSKMNLRPESTARFGQMPLVTLSWGDMRGWIED